MPNAHLGSIKFLCKPIHLVLLRWLGQIYQPLNELQHLINRNNRQANKKNRSPLIPIQWNDREEGLEEGNVEESEV